MCPRAAPTCEICEKVVSKYKCPSCLVPYCSLGCFKKHKGKLFFNSHLKRRLHVLNLLQPRRSQHTSPAKEVSVVENKDVVAKTEHKASASSAAKEVPVARPITVEEEKYVVEKTQLEAIASSSEIREALKDEALQKLISSIDSSSNPLQELDEAMGVEAFRLLTEKILSNISKSNDKQ
ncbi:hypothetical protein HID58_000793 [Brassica napus]|uniref:HIT-type domain-containing protein n=1 Tax=Brassica napus TaxID=3708 RepID=A0ABQ8EHU5_BRANA|nr:hypothetical protein HID58_000793 [Brassica napus]